jgi:CubicO group peptidase (beta-lactamase class C family)
MPAHARVLIEGDVVIEAQDAEAPVPWWSFGKTIIAATALRLAELGRLNLDDDGSGYSLRQVLRHEAGLKDYGALPAYHQAVAAGETPWPAGDLRRRAGANTHAFPPGQGWAYSNIGYLEARQRIEAAHPGTLEAAARRLIFEPLGVTARLAVAKDDLNGVEMGSARGYHPNWVYHGLFVGSLTEAARLLAGLLGPNSPLQAPSLAAMRQSHALPQFAGPVWKTPSYGLGLMRSATEGGFVAEGHTGGGPGSALAVYGREDQPGRVAAVFALEGAGIEVEAEAARLLA